MNVEAVPYDAIVLAGGQGRRLGGVSKPAIEIGGRRLLDIALEAVTGAARTIVVGATLPTTRSVEWTREQPAGGGPVAALAAALPLVTSETVVVLAADLPFVTPAAIDALVLGRADAAAAIAVDDTGRDQPLLACYDTELLRAAMPVEPQNAPMRIVFGDLHSGGIERLSLGGSPPVTWDCDTAADLTRAQELA
jgi:molybdopterin-guanine dinucleotide biosynthesis protein A